MFKSLTVLLGCTALALALSLDPNNRPQKHIQSTEVTNSTITPLIAFLGRVEYKSFFYENTGNKDWAQAKSFCEGMNMRLATIETQNELKFLTDAFEFNRIPWWYWTAARDSHTVRQLSWDRGNNDPTEIDMDLIVDASVIEPSLTCGTLNPNYDGPAQLYLLPCTSRYGNVGILCETT